MSEQTSIFDQLGTGVNDAIDHALHLAELIEKLPHAEKIHALNQVRGVLHEVSPFKEEPIDYVQWVPTDKVHANDYNPNSVAPPEMALLVHSVAHDGYTQPVVTWPDSDNSYEVVDGFHRTRVAKESAAVRERLQGYMPLVAIQDKNYDKKDRIASTIRHNRARGKHAIDSMSDIVIELKRRNWSNQRIMKELGMDEDEILRLCQITGLAELFSDQQFSAAWDVADGITEADFEELTDEVEAVASVAGDARVPNTSDENRIFHTYDKWECYKAGFYATTAENMGHTEAEEAYRDFLGDTARFSEALQGVITEWKNSCEHYLTNAAMNRIAWLGQASACYAMGLPCRYRSGFSLLTKEQQDEANNTALIYLNKWLKSRGMEAIDLKEAMSGGRQSDIY